MAMETIFEMRKVICEMRKKTCFGYVTIKSQNKAARQFGPQETEEQI